MNRFVALFKVIFSSAAPGVVCGETQSLYVINSESVADGRDDDLVAWEADPAFFGGLLIVDPDGEFAPPAFDQFGVDSQSVFEGGHHTGGTWPVRRSDFAKTNSHFTHGLDYTTRPEFLLRIGADGFARMTWIRKP